MAISMQKKSGGLNFSKKFSQIKYKITYNAVLAALAVPSVALADTVSEGLGSGIGDLFGNAGISSSTSLPVFIANVIRLLLYFAGAIAVVFIIIGGYYYLTSGGNEEQAEKGKKTLVNAIIGIILIALAYAIISVITQLVSPTA